MSQEPRPRHGSRMNAKKVIIWMTVGVFLILGFLILAVFGGWPPWPVVAAFTASHLFFCIVVARVRPFHGPYTKPMSEPDPADWRE